MPEQRDYAYSFRWNHTDPQATKMAESALSYDGQWSYRIAELDPMGANVGFAPPSPEPSQPPPTFIRGEFASPEAVEIVTVDGIDLYSNAFPGLMAIASRCPNIGCGAQRTANGWEYWTAFADGYEGYMSMSGYYAGRGRWSWQDDKTSVNKRERIAL